MRSKNILTSKLNLLSLFALLFLLLQPIKAQLQSFTHGEVKAALVGHIIKNIQWQQKANQTDILIMVYQDKDVLEMLTMLEAVKLKNKPVKVLPFENPKDASHAHVVYIPEAFNAQISSIISALRNTNTLVITENSPSRHNIMVNIVEANKNITQNHNHQFEFNRPNLSYEQLSVLPDLVLFGGSELDVAELYLETEKAIQALHKENEEVSIKLQNQQQLLATKEQQLNRLESKSNTLTKNMLTQQQSIKQQQQDLQRQEQQLIELSAKVKVANQKYFDAQQESDLKEQELAKSEQIFTEKEQAIATQSKRLDALKDQVEENQQLLVQQSSQLEQKNIEVAYQAQLIGKQTQIIWIISGIVALALIIFFLITKLLIKNRRINEALQDTIRRLEATQAQLVESEKMASLGQLVTGVAHELNTPLGISLTAISTIGDDVERIDRLVKSKTLKISDMTKFTSKLKDIDKLIQNNLERCHNLIYSFKQVSADQAVEESREIKLNDYIVEVMRTLSVHLKQNHVEYQITGDNPTLVIDPGAISQVINNLTTNAINHAFTDITHRSITIDIGLTEHAIEILFTDSGKGMDKETTKKVFEPFFTTKRGQGGTGLGMNIVYNLVTTKLGGTIKVESELQKGTKFYISLPYNQN